MIMLYICVDGFLFQGSMLRL